VFTSYSWYVKQLHFKAKSIKNHYSYNNLQLWKYNIKDVSIIKHMGTEAKGALFTVEITLSSS
jgi:hypothetical protein